MRFSVRLRRVGAEREVVQWKRCNQGISVSLLISAVLHGMGRIGTTGIIIVCTRAHPGIPVAMGSATAQRKQQDMTRRGR